MPEHDYDFEIIAPGDLQIGEHKFTEYLTASAGKPLPKKIPFGFGIHIAPAKSVKKTKPRKTTPVRKTKSKTTAAKKKVKK